MISYYICCEISVEFSCSFANFLSQ